MAFMVAITQECKTKASGYAAHDIPPASQLVVVELVTCHCLHAHSSVEHTAIKSNPFIHKPDKENRKL